MAAEGHVAEGGVLRTRVMSSSQHKPGHTWVVLAEEDGAFNVTLPLGFGRSQPNIWQPKCISIVRK